MRSREEKIEAFEKSLITLFSLRFAKIYNKYCFLQYIFIHWRRRVEEGRAVRRREGRGEEGEDKRYLL